MRVLDIGGKPILIAPQDQSHPVLALNPSNQNLLLVWQDERNEKADIYGMRLQSDFSIIDPPGEIPLSSTAYNQKSPDVVFDALLDKYFIVWEDHRNDDVNIYGTYLRAGSDSPDPLDGFLIVEKKGDLSAPGVSSIYAQLLVVWNNEDSDSEGDIEGALIKPETPEQATIVSISSTKDDETSPTVSPFGGIVVWSDNREIEDEDEESDLTAVGHEQHTIFGALPISLNLAQP